MKKIITTLLIGIFLITSASALDTLKPAKLNQEYKILQTCASCTFVNISVSNINGLIISNAEMTNNGSGVWTYDFTPTTTGRYDVTGVGDLNGDNTSFAASFEVSPSGLIGTLGFYFIILILSIGIIIFGFKIEDPWVIVLGGFSMILVGLYTMFYGIDGIKDTTYTWGIGIITLMLGCYFSIRASVETMS